MASSVPYAAPYSRSTEAARPTVHFSGEIRRFVGFCLALILIYALVQLALAGVASATLHELDRLDTAIATAKIERDSLRARVEDLKNPANIEEWAVRKGYVPLTNVEFVR